MREEFLTMMVATVRKDNMVVTLLSAYIGSETVDNICRYDKELKQKIDVPCSKIAQKYNSNMGGLDLIVV